MAYRIRDTIPKAFGLEAATQGLSWNAKDSVVISTISSGGQLACYHEYGAGSAECRETGCLADSAGGRPTWPDGPWARLRRLLCGYEGPTLAAAFRAARSANEPENTASAHLPAHDLRVRVNGPAGVVRDPQGGTHRRVPDAKTGIPPDSRTSDHPIYRRELRRLRSAAKFGQPMPLSRLMVLIHDGLYRPDRVALRVLIRKYGGPPASYEDSACRCHPDTSR